MRLDLPRLRRQPLGYPGVDRLFAFRIGIANGDVGIGDGRLFEILVDAASTALVAGLQLDRHPGAVLDLDPLDAGLVHFRPAGLGGRDVLTLSLAVEDLGQVSLGVDLDLVVVQRLALADLGDDPHRPAGGQQPIHAGGADADPLLAAAHPQAVELRAVQQPAEDQGDLLFDDARPVVLHAYPEAILPGRQDVDPHFREDAGFFAGVQGVVHGLLDGRQEGFSWIVKAEKMAILGKEFTDRDVPLAGGHRLRGRAAAGTFFQHWFLGMAITLGGLVAIGFYGQSVCAKDLRICQSRSS